MNKKILHEISSWTLLVVGTFILALVFNSTAFAKVEVEESSMEKTLFDKQHLIIDKLSYNFTKPKQGDVIIFLKDDEKGNTFQEIVRSFDSIKVTLSKDKSEKPKNRYVKRVIGVAGDEVDIRDGYVYVNGERLEESYANGETYSGDFKLPVVVEENTLFVLGDNRNVSIDSRDFGLINCNQVEGKVVFRVYPFNTIGKIN